VVGLITPADLNKTAARASFYLLIAEFERRLVRLIRRELPNEADYCKYLTKERITKLRKEQDDASKEDLGLNLSYYLYLTDLANIARKDPILRQKLGKPSKSYMKSIIDVRNAVDHPANLLSSHPTNPLSTEEKHRNLYTVYQRLLDLEKRMQDAGA